MESVLNKITSDTNKTLGMQEKLNKIIEDIKSLPNAKQVANGLSRSLKITQMLKLIPSKHLPAFYVDFSEYSDLLQSLISGVYVDNRQSYAIINRWNGEQLRLLSTEIGLGDWYNILQHLNDYLSGETERIDYMINVNVDPIAVFNLSQEIKKLLTKFADDEMLCCDEANDLMTLIWDVNRSFGVPEVPEAPDVVTIV